MEEQQKKVDLSQGPGTKGYVVPAELVPLPSMGKVYPNPPLAGATGIEIKAMTAREEDILTSRALIKSGRVITELLKSCICDRSIDPDELVTGDRNAVLVALRITGYGSDYTVDVECPECGDTKKGHIFDLSKLPIKTLDVEPIRPGTNAFEFMLPVSKKRVLFSLMTGKMDRDMNLTTERTKKAGMREEPVTTKLITQVTQVEGIEPNGLVEFIKNMPANDSRKLRNYIDKVSPLIDMTQKFTCPLCDSETEVDVPLGAEFFWPST